MCLTKEIKNLNFMKKFSNTEKCILESIYNFFSTRESTENENEIILSEIEQISNEKENIESIKNKLNFKIYLIEDIYFFIENELKLKEKEDKYNSRIKGLFIDFKKPKYEKSNYIYSKQNKNLQDIWNIHFAHKKELN